MLAHCDNSLVAEVTSRGMAKEPPLCNQFRSGFIVCKRILADTLFPIELLFFFTQVSSADQLLTPVPLAIQLGVQLFWKLEDRIDWFTSRMKGTEVLNPRRYFYENRQF